MEKQDLSSEKETQVEVDDAGGEVEKSTTASPPEIKVEEPLDSTSTSPPPSPSPTSRTKPPPTPPKQNPALPMKTPAPSAPTPSTPLVPSAPAPKSIPKDLPAQTPLSAATPMPSGPDLSEFDPFATPAPGNATSQSTGDGTGETPVPGPSTPRREPRQQQQPQRTDSDPGQVGGEPAFNFSGFLKDIKSKPADPIARYLKRYVSVSASRER